MSLARRVADLEDYSGGVCSECGHDPSSLVAYRIVWETDEAAPGESSLPCHHCGNVAVEVIGWEDERSERPQESYKKLHARQDDDDLAGSEGSQESYKKLRRLDDVDDDEGGAAQVPDYPPRIWDDSEARGEGGGVDGY